MNLLVLDRISGCGDTEIVILEVLGHYLVLAAEGGSITRMKLEAGREAAFRLFDETARELGADR